MDWQRADGWYGMEDGMVFEDDLECKSKSVRYWVLERFDPR